MNNHRKRQINKLISNLCTLGILCSTSSSQKITSWYSNNKVYDCEAEIADLAAAQFYQYLENGVVPYLREKTGLTIKEDKHEDPEKLQKRINGILNNFFGKCAWTKFIDESMEKYKLTKGILSDREKLVLEALKAALYVIGRSGHFEKILIFDNPTKISLDDLLLEVAGYGSQGVKYWTDDIREKLTFKLSAITKLAILIGSTAGAGYAFMMLYGYLQNVNKQKLVKETLEFARKQQEKEDLTVTSFANKVDINPKNIDVDKLKTMLETEAKDYPYAKSEMNQFIDTYIGIIIAKKENPLAKCPPIILIGRPGCGKTEWIKRVIKCTFACVNIPEKENQPATPITNWQEHCILINQDKIDKNSSVSPRDQISGTHEEKREDVTVTCYSDSAAANKFGKGIHLKYIDEIEKLLIDVILSIWDTADSGGRSIVLATGNGNPADYIKGDGADFKEAFEDRAIIIELPKPDKAYIEYSIKKLIDEINVQNPDKSPVVVSGENMKGLVDSCRSMRSVATMKSPILGLQLSQTLAGQKIVPIKIDPKNPRPERIIVDKSYPG